MKDCELGLQTDISENLCDIQSLLQSLPGLVLRPYSSDTLPVLGRYKLNFCYEIFQPWKYPNRFQHFLIYRNAQNC